METSAFRSHQGWACARCTIPLPLVMGRARVPEATRPGVKTHDSLPLRCEEAARWLLACVSD